MKTVGRHIAPRLKADPAKPAAADQGFSSKPQSIDSFSAGSKTQSNAVPRSNHSDAASAGANQGVYKTAVSAALLGVTGLGALGCATPVVAQPVNLDLDAPVTRDATTHYADSIGVEMSDMPTISLDETSSVESKTDRVIERFHNDLIEKSTITASDYANPDSFETLDGMPGYKKIDKSVLRGMLLDTLRDLPLSELPGGDAVADIVKLLPSFQNRDVSSMSANEIEDALQDDAKAWFDSRFGEFIEENETVLTAGTFAALTSARYASSDARELINNYTPSIAVADYSSESGMTNANAELKYRGDDLLPNLDLSATARRDVGPVSLRTELTSSMSLDKLSLENARLSAGARVGDANLWADGSAWVDAESNHGARFEVGTVKNVNGYHLSGTTSLDVGPGATIDPNADGRFSLNVTAAKNFRDSNDNVRGSFGLYGSHSIDTNGAGEDTSVGVMFRWSF
ncbi:MAG: hypothetical protein VYC39_07660 [Myxococcota bacterium]|nr:hypothetical protein [Myxococcota bacterium]